MTFFFYKWEENINNRLLLVVPDKLKSQILRFCHDVRCNGHLRQDKTLAKLRRLAFWHGMVTDCKVYVNSCAICNRQKKPCKKAKAVLGQYHAGSPFERLHIDLMGPRPESKAGNKYTYIGHNRSIFKIDRMLSNT